jgi:heme-degrading monooxygenase HmoA
MYARLTRLPFPPDREADVREFWTNEAGGAITRQPGFRLAITLAVTEDLPAGEDPSARAITLWDAPEDFARWHSGGHTAVNQPIADAGMRITEREAADVLMLREAPEPVTGEFRFIRSRVDADQVERVLAWWVARGREVIESAAGCNRARGFWDAAASEFCLAIWWRSAEDAEAFRLSEYHEREFVQGLGPGVERLTRAHLVPLD